MIAVPGFWDNSGTWINAPNTFTLSCDSEMNEDEQYGWADGAISVCARLQYDFDNTTHREALLACVRAVRGDYCGDGEPHTMNGTHVAFYDNIFSPFPPMACGTDGRCFEASWSKDGAVRIARPRWKDPHGDMGYKKCLNYFGSADADGVRTTTRQLTEVFWTRSEKYTCGTSTAAMCTARETELLCPHH
ncbi:MAG TPA: ADYC domain-containing protein [Kofleriaceae bacterium]